MRVSQARERNAFRTIGLEAKRRKTLPSAHCDHDTVSSISSVSDQGDHHFSNNDCLNEIPDVSDHFSPNPSESDCSTLSSDEVDPTVDEYVKRHLLEKMVLTKDARTGLYKADFDETLALGARRLPDLSFLQTTGPTACELAGASLLYQVKHSEVLTSFCS